MSWKQRKTTKAKKQFKCEHTKLNLKMLASFRLHYSPTRVSEDAQLCTWVVRCDVSDVDSALVTTASPSSALSVQNGNQIIWNLLNEYLPTLETELRKQEREIQKNKFEDYILINESKTIASCEYYIDRHSKYLPRSDDMTLWLLLGQASGMLVLDSEDLQR